MKTIKQYELKVVHVKHIVMQKHWEQLLFH